MSTIIKDVGLFEITDNFCCISSGTCELYISIKNIESILLNKEVKSDDVLLTVKLRLIMKSQHIFYIEYREDKELKIFKELTSHWDMTHVPENDKETVIESVTGAGPEVDLLGCDNIYKT
jgi:hypothetical protein